MVSLLRCIGDIGLLSDHNLIHQPARKQASRLYNGPVLGTNVSLADRQAPCQIFLNTGKQTIGSGCEDRCGDTENQILQGGQLTLHLALLDVGVIPVLGQSKCGNFLLVQDANVFLPLLNYLRQCNQKTPKDIKILPPPATSSFVPCWKTMA